MPGGKFGTCKGSESRQSMRFAGQEVQKAGGKHERSVGGRVERAPLCTRLANLGTDHQAL